MTNDFTPDLAKLLQSPSYRVAYKDVDLLNQPELRPARMELELIKPELYFQQNNIRSTVVVFGSTQIVEPSVARTQVEQAKRALAEAPGDPQRQREVAIITKPRGSSPGWFPSWDNTRSKASTSSSPAAGRASWRRPTAARTTWRPSRSA
jgi:hypothetical protein